jgi:hypothetical protein
MPGNSPAFQTPIVNLFFTWSTKGAATAVVGNVKGRWSATTSSAPFLIIVESEKRNKRLIVLFWTVFLRGGSYSAGMGGRKRDNDDERLARIDMLLEELRLNMEDMRELAKQATERAVAQRREARAVVQEARERVRGTGKER